ncbi:hypothetical protein EV294_10171 [Paenibacillus sp. BK033]|nr:hypothetical protein EV294_10171 [Paenibacillus sp. BK033]
MSFQSVHQKWFNMHLKNVKEKKKDLFKGMLMRRLCFCQMYGTQSICIPNMR